MSRFEDIQYVVEDSAAVITINRPERYNAFRAKTVDELIKAFRLAWADRHVQSVILTGGWDRMFDLSDDLPASIVLNESWWPMVPFLGMAAMLYWVAMKKKA